MLLDTARYWASRVRVDAAGRGHIDDVIGPDEYHEHVDDNAYTNVMARWNLRAAAELADHAGPAGLPSLGDQAAHWRDLADRIVDLRDPVTGVHEQFAGYHGLEPLGLADIATGPVAADALLGRERTAGSQLIKQPDVLMLHHLVPDEVPGSLDADLDRYGPRTTHGSSLSPAITAALLARAGRTDEALAMLRLVLDLDLDRSDLFGTTAGGLHMAALGGAWQAVLHGFAGVSVAGTTVCVDPHLPDAWPSLEIRFRCLDRRIRLDVRPDAVRVCTDRPVAVRIGTGPTRWVQRVAEVAREDPPLPRRSTASTGP
jgi:trehalose/maltose hydrolase-like predicted phosphorylase